MPVFFPSSTSSSSSAPANVYNFAPTTNLTHWRTAKARVRGGTGNARIMCVGDSTTFGVGATGSLTAGNMVAQSFPTFLSAALNTGGLNAHWNSFCGGGDASAGVPSRAVNDSRLVVGSDFSYTATTIGGPYIAATTNTGNKLSFTPTVNVDTFQVIYHQSSSDGSFTLDINGSGTQTINAGTGGSFAVASTTITGTLGSNTLNIKWASGGEIYIIGISAWDSSKKWVDCMNMGWAGSTVSSWVAAGVMQPAGSVTPGTVVAPDLTIINLGINDWVAGTALASYVSNLQKIVTQALAYGDVILMTPNPSGQTTGGGETGISLATQYQYVQSIIGLGYSNNIPVFDLWNRWGTQEVQAAVPVPFVFNDYHPIAAGYQDIGNFLGKALLTA